MLPINNPELVVKLVNRYGYVYDVARRSLKLEGEYATFETPCRGNWNFNNTVTILREEIGTVEENPEFN